MNSLSKQPLKPSWGWRHPVLSAVGLTFLLAVSTMGVMGRLDESEALAVLAFLGSPISLLMIPIFFAMARSGAADPLAMVFPVMPVAAGLLFGSFLEARSYASAKRTLLWHYGSAPIAFVATILLTDQSSKGLAGVAGTLSARWPSLCVFTILYGSVHVVAWQAVKAVERKGLRTRVP